MYFLIVYTFQPISILLDKLGRWMDELIEDRQIDKEINSTYL